MTTTPSDPPPGPPPTGPPTAPTSRPWLSRNQWLAIGAVIVLVAGIAVGALVIGGSDEAAAAEVFLAPTSDVGPNPFTPNVANTPPSTVASATTTPTTAASGTVSVSGAAPGLYGGTQDNSSCDAQQMITFLQQNPDRARAWAEVEGIQPADIPAYIGGLTPLILRVDTRVTNHGFANGRATARATILQAGTAVLVDKYGLPRARCYCGNPLTPPSPVSNPTYTGPKWTGFSPTTVIVVQQTVIVDIFVVVDVTTGQTFGRPAGTSGRSDRPAPDQLPTTRTSTTNAGTTTTAGAAGELLDGTYTLTAEPGGSCAGTGGSAQLTVQGDSATLLDPATGQTYQGTIDREGAGFHISTTDGVNSFTVDGTIGTGGVITGSATLDAPELNFNCSVPVNGQRG